MNPFTDAEKYSCKEKNLCLSSISCFLPKILGIAGILGAVGGTIWFYKKNTETRFQLRSPHLTNPIIQPQQIYNDGECNGENISPELIWINPPVGTKSFAVTMYDPDAPTGSGWWHWLMVNIPATTDKLPLNAGCLSGKHCPRGAIQTLNDYGVSGYGGPCLPKGDGDHRYIFTVYALGIPKLDVQSNTMPATVGFMIQANKIAEARIIRKYGRV